MTDSKTVPNTKMIVEKRPEGLWGRTIIGAEVLVCFEPTIEKLQAEMLRVSSDEGYKISGFDIIFYKDGELIDARELGRRLFKIHTHAEIVYDENPDLIVYSERDIIALLKEFGFPEPKWED